MSINSAEISQENLMLKKLNQRAFSKISSLEAKVSDLKTENEKLLQKISDKHRKKEEVLGSAFTDFFQSKESTQSTKSLEKKHTSNYYTDKETELLAQFVSRESGNFAIQNKTSMQNITPDTSSTDENASNVDSFLNLETSEPVTSDFTNSNPAYEKNTSYVNLTYNEDSSILNKRKYTEFEVICTKIS
jgi:hypothetical protein